MTGDTITAIASCAINRRRFTRQVDITFHWRSWRSEDTLPSPAHYFLGFERAVAGAIYRRALARGAVNCVLSSAVGAERRSYFNDQVTGRSVERSAWVCTNLSRRVYSFPVTALSLAFQRNSLSSSAINSRTVRRGWRLRTAAIMLTRVSASIVACSASERMGTCNLRLAAANLRAVLLLRTRRLRARRRSLCRYGWRGCHLPSGTAFMNQGGLKQLGNRRLIGLEQFIRPLQSLESPGQRLAPADDAPGFLAQPRRSPRAVAFGTYLPNSSSQWFLKGRRAATILALRPTTYQSQPLKRW